jgi:S-adenosylmethionine decarboxylase proenzyme
MNARHGAQLQTVGTHLVIDLIGAERLDDLAHVEQMLRACVAATGATLLHIHLHHFTPNGGISGVAVLAESHISIHSWPEHDYAALDVFVCGAGDPHKAVDVMRAAFQPRRVVVGEYLRGWGDGRRQPVLDATGCGGPSQSQNQSRINDCSTQRRHHVERAAQITHEEDVREVAP